MPEIARFDGISFSMYYKPKEHEPSHVHVYYGDYAAEINILTGEILAGSLPSKIRKSAVEWVVRHRSELQSMWDKQAIHTLPQSEQ